MTEPSVPKVLIVAANVSSKFGGEAFLPLKYFQILQARGHNVKLITHARNRTDLTKTLASYLDDIHFIEDTVWHRIVWNTGNFLPGRVAENFTRIVLDLIDDIYQRDIIFQLIADGDVDVIHQPIPVSPLSPSTLHKFDKPLVVGPMNGNMSYPKGYEDYESFLDRLLVGMARRLAPLVNFIAPGKHRAKTLLVANQRTKDAINFIKHSNVVELVENGVDLSLFKDGAVYKDEARKNFRLAYMGRLPRWKALDITLKAIAQVRHKGVDVELDIMGDGTERENLEKLSVDLGISEAVRFHGFMPQVQCAEILHKSDALILNSLYECGGAVVLEAMSIGLPVITTSWGGPADYVDSECGILVDPVPRENFPERLGDAIAMLAKDRNLCQQMGAAGTQKIRDHFDWEKKVDVILDIYADAQTAN